MGKRPLIIVEHLEPELSPWLLLEYRHASKITGKENIMYTNVPRIYHRILSIYGQVSEKSVLDLFDHEKLLILDPRASEPLTKNDLEIIDAVVIGGILGDHPPKGRTYEYLSSKARKALKRNIGKGQYSIDGAVYVVLEVLNKGSLECIKYVDGIELSKRINKEEIKVYLPFRYPIVNNRPLIAPGLKEYLLDGRLPDYIMKELSNNIVLSNEGTSD